MAEYIEREALLKDIAESVRFTVKAGHPSAEIRGANKIVDRIKSAPAADVVEIETLKDWLITTAINDVTFVHDGYFPKACTKLVSQLDKLREFAKERSL